MFHAILLYAGLTSPNTPWYLFWSGIGADWTRLLSSLVVVGGFAKVLHQRAQHHAEMKEQAERHHKERMNSG